MTVEELYKNFRAKAIKLGVSQELLTEPFFIKLVNDALRDFCSRTKCNLKQVYTVTVADKEYYTLPSDFVLPKHVELDEESLSGLSIIDYLMYKRRI